MDTRKEKILNIILKEYIKTAIPVGSAILAGKYNLGISSATIRNEMSELERMGYICQPHTSAGRMPTEKAYQYYISSLEKKELPESKKREIDLFLEEKDYRKIAKYLAQACQSAVFWAFHKNDLYYTGLSNLLQQPEFSQAGLVYDISLVIDKMDEIISEFFEEIQPGLSIFLGEENPFGNLFGVNICKYRNDNGYGLLGLLGPMRMNYSRNLSWLKYIEEKI